MILHEVDNWQGQQSETGQQASISPDVKKFKLIQLENSTKKMICLQQRFAIQLYLARPCIISGQDARTTRNFGIFFQLEVS